MLPATPPITSAAPAGSATGGGARSPTRLRIDRLTVLNWLAFLAILGMTLGEGCAMQAAKRREAREAREAAQQACAAAVAGVGLALGSPPGAPPPADCAP